MTDVIVLDVGHGNAAIIRHDGDQTVVVDAPLRDALLDALRAEGITHIKLAIASHSDSDHCGGFIGLLLDRDIIVDELRINADPTRNTRASQRKFWGDLKVALLWAKQAQGTHLRVELTDEVSDDISSGELRLEVLLPQAVVALDGVGAAAPEGGVLTPNAMSAVIRVVLDGDPLVLLTGDMDAAGLQRLEALGVDAHSRVLVFPHHGGVPEGATTSAGMTDFASRLIALCQPATVLFSLARVGHANPRPEFVAAIRAAGTDIHVACTQLSKRCSPDPLPNASHLTEHYSAGRATARCCLGTALLIPSVGLAAPLRQAHEQAIGHLPARLCR